MRSTAELIRAITGGESAAHAYIIEGRQGKAREDFVKEILKSLGCSSLDEVHMQMSGKTSYKTDDANAFAERLSMGAYGPYLVGIIDDADSLSEVVQNKLLKTLEEPGDSVILLLCASNRDYLLSTVRSRCGVIRLSDYVDVFEDSGDADHGNVKEAADLLADPDAAFYEFRDALDKQIKTKADALALLDAAEDVFREQMLNGDIRAAESIELAEKARVDIERDMDRNKALKRLRLELERA